MVNSSMDPCIRNCIQIVAHRGFSGIYPENTLLSIKKAMELGVDFIEVDVRQTKDGELVILHDEKIDRTTDGNGYVNEITYSQLKKFDAGAWKGFHGEKIPHLMEVFDIIGGRCGLLIEIKQCDIEKLCRCISKNCSDLKMFIGSFNIDYIEQVRSILPALPATLISFSVPDHLNRLIEKGIRKLDIHYRSLNSEIVRSLVGKGFLVNCWTVDEENEMITCINMGVQFITTNRPDILKSLVE